MVFIDSPFIRKLNTRTYWSATKTVCNQKLEELVEQKGEKEGYVEIMNYLTEIMWNSEEGVNRIRKKILQSKKTLDISQSNVSTAGNNYQALVSYCLEMNRVVGNLSRDIRITLKPKKHPIIQKYAEIEVVGGETQRPDVDILIYKNEEKTPIVILSCKTSLRERAGQTYRWKLLMDMALCNCSHDSGCPINKYELNYASDRDVYVGLVTADFYDERENPQQKGMFTFFDHVYVSKPITEFGNVRKLDSVVNDLNLLFESD